MRKILIGLFVVLLIGTSAVYIFIPSQINASSIEQITAPMNAVYRQIDNNDNWQKWSHQATNSIQQKISSTNPATNSIGITVYHGIDSVETTLTLLALNGYDLAVQWNFAMETGNNPFEKIKRYNEAMQIKKAMDSTLINLKNFASKEENLYGFKIKETSTTDTLLISTKTKLTHYPNTDEIYNLIDKLKNYAAQTNAAVSGHPMYNVTNINGDTVRLMVAIPINKRVPETGDVTFVRMVEGRFLTTEVTGGEASVINTLKQLQNYYRDHNRSQMAITFTYLVTDRREQPDTTKWVNKIYGPVM